MHRRILASCVSETCCTAFLFRPPVLLVFFFLAARFFFLPIFSAAHDRALLDECPSRSSRLDRQFTVIQKSRLIFSFSSQSSGDADEDRFRPFSSRSAFRLHSRCLHCSPFQHNYSRKELRCHKVRFTTFGLGSFAVGVPIDQQFSRITFLHARYLQ